MVMLSSDLIIIKCFQCKKKNTKFKQTSHQVLVVVDWAENAAGFQGRCFGKQARPTPALRCSAVASWEHGIAGSSRGSLRSQPVAGAHRWAHVN